MTEPANDNRKTGGLGRIVSAAGYSWAGFRHAVLREPAIRDELILLVILTPIAVAIHVTSVERLILVLLMLLVILVEFLNSAIEAAVDRVSTEKHPLAARAKDLGSAAVFMALMMSALSWLMIAGPLLVRSVLD
jgi:diacylglycerol kinase (ATP)